MSGRCPDERCQAPRWCPNTACSFINVLAYDEHGNRRVSETPAACPSCGAELHDMRGTGFNVYQAAAANRCVRVSDSDYTCAVKSRWSPRQLRDAANGPWEGTE